MCVCGKAEKCTELIQSKASRIRCGRVGQEACVPSRRHAQAQALRKKWVGGGGAEKFFDFAITLLIDERLVVRHFYVYPSMNVFFYLIGSPFTQVFQNDELRNFEVACVTWYGIGCALYMCGVNRSLYYLYA